MRNRPLSQLVLVSLASLLFAAGCAPPVSIGGGVEGEPGEGGGGTTVIEGTNPNPNPPSADPLEGQPRPAPAADLPTFLAGATKLEVRGDTLGAPPGASNRRSYRLDLASNDVFVTLPNLLGGMRLSAADRAELDELFARVAEMPMPDLCAYDGPTADLVVTRDGVGTTYLAEDYNCLHRKDVRYAKSVGAVLAWFDAHVRLPGASP
ncbi:MAG: hypothetical protein IPF92_25835 [Myxococcales bacterium]|nr:hypothetical protein [Myxococcales bacterium]